LILSIGPHRERFNVYRGDGLPALMHLNGIASFQGMLKRIAPPLGPRFVEERFRLPQIEGVEALGEPGVDGSDEVASVGRHKGAETGKAITRSSP
jgi:hypothetical protein